MSGARGDVLMSRRPQPRLRSVEAKLVATTSLVLVIVSTTLFFWLAERERTSLIEAKAVGATMVVQLLATGVGAAIDFGDSESVSARLGDLRANPDIVGAAVWSDPTKQPTAAWASAVAPVLLAPQPSEPDGWTTSTGWLVATRTVVAPSGAPLARMRVTFSLAPENEAFTRSRVQLFWMTTGLTLATAVVLVLLARRFVVGPVRRLARAAAALADGDLSARVDVHSNDDIGELARAFGVMRQAVAFREETLKKEIDLAQRIQTSILPATPQVAGLTIAGMMVPTSKVGGDYYDVLPVADGCWIGIGDVAGHGLDAGLVMIMIQSIVAGLVARDPRASPRDVVCTLNEVLFDNIHNRLKRDDHATLTLLRYDRAGVVTFAGAHEDILVYRAASGRCEVVETRGTWVGGRRDIRQGTVEGTLTLAPGDMLLLHTDGATEIRNALGEEFGLERLKEAFEKCRDEPPSEVLQQLLFAAGGWGEAEDDVTFLVGRYGD